jgi:hypothetical protein
MPEPDDNYDRLSRALGPASEYLDKLSVLQVAVATAALAEAQLARADETIRLAAVDLQHERGRLLKAGQVERVDLADASMRLMVAPTSTVDDDIGQFEGAALVVSRAEWDVLVSDLDATAAEGWGRVRAHRDGKKNQPRGAESGGKAQSQP